MHNYPKPNPNPNPNPDYFFRLLLSAFIARSCIFSRMRVRVHLLLNSVGWLPSAVAEYFARLPLIHTIGQQLYSNSHSNKKLQHRAINVPVWL